MKLPQLSLRELFLLVALVAMGCGWLVDHGRQVSFAAHWKGEALKLSSWVDQNCNWVNVGLSDENEILILRDPTAEEMREFESELQHCK